MKNKRKEFDEQTYSSKTNPETTNLQEERDTTNETSTHNPTHGEERYSELPEKTLAESDMAQHAQRLVANYVRSLLLF